MLQWPSYKKWDLVNQSRLKQEFDKTKVWGKEVIIYYSLQTLNYCKCVNVLVIYYFIIYLSIFFKAASKAKTKRVVDTPEFYVTAIKTRPDGSTLKVRSLLRLLIFSFSPSLFSKHTFL